MFNKESMEKKKIGSNVHRMTGKGKRGGIKGGIRFAKNNFKRYEKNSKVTTENIFDNVIPFKEFKTYEEDHQQLFLYEWRRRYSNSYIQKEMQLSINKYNKLIEELDIEDIERDEIYMLSSEEMDEAKQYVIPYHEFKELPDYQKFELIDHYMKELKLKTRDIVEKWNNKVSQGTLSTQKSNWKKSYEEWLSRGGNNMKESRYTKEDDQNLQYLLGGIKEDPTVSDTTSADTAEDTEEIKQDRRNEKHTISERAESESSSFTVNDDYDEHVTESFKVEINGNYIGTNLKNRVNNLMDLIGNLNKYEVRINIKEVENSGNSTETEILESIANLLKTYNKQ